MRQILHERARWAKTRLGGGDYMVQSALWPRDRQVGSKMRRKSRNIRHVIAGSYRHEMVAGVYCE